MPAWGKVSVTGKQNVTNKLHTVKPDSPLWEFNSENADTQPIY